MRVLGCSWVFFRFVLVAAISAPTIINKLHSSHRVQSINIQIQRPPIILCWFIHILRYIQRHSTATASDILPMPTERYSTDCLTSLIYCIKHYASYGKFATYRLRTVVSATDVYTFESFKQAFLASGDNHCKNPKLQKFLETISYEDSDYFSIPEIRFLLELTAFCPPQRLKSCPWSSQGHERD